MCEYSCVIFLRGREREFGGCTGKMLPVVVDVDDDDDDDDDVVVDDVVVDDVVVDDDVDDDDVDDDDDDVAVVFMIIHLYKYVLLWLFFGMYFSA